MLRTMLLSKIHRAHVTMRDLNYVGSITIDKNLLDASGMKPNEKVEVYNISNGNRFATYILEGEAGSGVIGVNGAAARLVSLDDKVIIVNFGQLNEEEMKNHKAKILIIEDDLNQKFITLEK
ncbi:MAG: aspartate 1-decarboxylase [Candidatus Cloacimonetes bacterium]|nr:aspartate 1-decarboxylase [Candidatus Cloacimonadota bacterium]MCF7813717.1 aspartate 1-decarboxylase [Candidatus Cloacimonadota bacterium]MCF7867783.1 aspartate 1-decarboxylase [Candidatus Cloacimonadota bacterium]MCF7883239.1 aspartate 1-decarboxylase [Candidatus Cloacimonadota bacterium]